MQLDGREIFSAFAEHDRNRGETLHPESELPFPKAAIRQVLQHVIRLRLEPDSRSYLETLYVRLAGYQTMSTIEAELVSEIDRLLMRIGPELSPAQIEGVVLSRDPDGTYRRISAAATEQMIAFMDELPSLQPRL